MDVLKLPEEIIQVVLSALDFKDCFVLSELNLQWNQAMKQPHNWPTKLTCQNWISNRHQLKLFMYKLYDLRVPITHLEWGYFPNAYTMSFAVQKQNYFQHMPLELVSISGQFIMPYILEALCKSNPLRILSLTQCYGKYGKNVNLKKLKNAKTLTDLELCQSAMTGTGSELLPLLGYCQLTRLNLAQTNTNDKAIVIICKFPLVTLDISYTEVHDVSLPLLKSKKIQKLNLYACKFTLDGFKKTWSEYDDLDKLNEKNRDDDHQNHQDHKDSSRNEKKSYVSLLQSCIRNMSAIFQRSINDGGHNRIYNINTAPNGGPTMPGHQAHQLSTQMFYGDTASFIHTRTLYDPWDAPNANANEEMNRDLAILSQYDYDRPDGNIWSFHEQQSRNIGQMVRDDLGTRGNEILDLFPVETGPGVLIPQEPSYLSSNTGLHPVSPAQ